MYRIHTCHTHHLVTHYADRGIIEIGAGHGQWAKALHDYYQKMKDTTATTTTMTMIKYSTVQATFAAKAKQSHWAAMISTGSYVGG
jgi:hypothetical protein